MALFSKPPLKKPAPAATPAGRPASKPAGRPAVSAREVAAQAAGQHKAKPATRSEPAEVSVTGASIIDWSASTPAPIEVAQANPGLCTVLENAALMYASGQPAAARSLLEHGVVSDEDTKLSALAWLALFDLLQRAGDRAAFDQFALQYVVQFERSAPAWDEQGAQAGAAIKPVAGGYVAITGKLDGNGFGPLEGLRRALDKRVPRARVDLSQVSEFDDAGARALADLLGRARHHKLELSLQRPERLRAAVESAVAQGTAGGEGAWLLSLELMQWQHAQAAFEDRALEFAVAFERSPPSWEPPPAAAAVEPGAAGAPDAADVLGTEAAEATGAAELPADDNAILRWSGVLTGSGQRHLAQLADFALSRPVLTIEFSAVERIDFVCAGALLNAINRIEGQRKVVQVAGATPIIRALLLLIGISPRHFIRQAA
jgi:ABC-type transporter Mla MlaB component